MSANEKQLTFILFPSTSLLLSSKNIANGFYCQHPQLRCKINYTHKSITSNENDKAGAIKGDEKKECFVRNE